ncbi:hypothetical protein H0H81_010028 [Sphagnurus paluster]|uniref:Uncharacterized protein n=1 Tax=Sphagnurus paluster TaxID=117069 RepID=A0A9P7FUY3_9AGAR|nr:hypothetical protein H0H81_010028 [Sphagnurus paluster]
MLMQTFVPIFFERFGAEFPFLQYEQVVAEAWERRLPAMLSNSIAAIAARYADNISELVVRGLHNVSETYLDNAKVGHRVFLGSLLVLMHTLLRLSEVLYRTSHLWTLYTP